MIIAVAREVNPQKYHASRTPLGSCAPMLVSRERGQDKPFTPFRKG